MPARREAEELRARLGAQAGGDPAALARRAARRHRDDRDAEPLLEVARALWRGGGRRERELAILLAGAAARRLEDRHWKEFRGWLDEARTLRECDLLAGEVFGPMVKRDRSWCRVLGHWARSRRAWDRRAAARAVLPRTRQMSDGEAALPLLGALLDDPAAEVREAAEALLAEAQAAAPEETAAFLLRRRGRFRRGRAGGAGGRPARND